MWPRFYKDDYLTVIHYLGVLVQMVGIFMLIPLAVAFACKEWNPAIDFILSIGVTLFIGTLMTLVKPDARAISRRQALVVVGLLWITASFVTAIPLCLSGHYAGYLDSFFDAVSGFTDSGVALVEDVDHMAYSVNFWRFILQLVGGQGIVVVALGLGAFAHSQGAGDLYRAEGRSEMILPRLRDTAAFIVKITMGFVAAGTIFGSIALMFKGFHFWSAVYHSSAMTMAAFATGGFSPMPNSVIYYHSPVLETILMVIMLSGAFSFGVYSMMLQKGPRELLKDIENKTIVVWATLCLTVLAISLGRDEWFGQAAIALHRGVFTIVSAVSNTGFQTFYSSQVAGVMSTAAMFAILLSMIMGGASSSTTGGIKGIRFALVLKTIVNNIKNRLSPMSSKTRVSYYHLGRQALTDEIARSAMLILLLFLLTYMLGAGVAILYGFDPMDALFESVSICSNTGMSVGIVSPSIPAGLKLTYILEMLAGRLEFLTLFATFATLFNSVLRGLFNIPVVRKIKKLEEGVTE